MLSDYQVETLEKDYQAKGQRLDVEREKLRSVYSTEEGKVALTRLIITGKVFGKMTTSEGDIAIHNLVIDILEQCGFLDEKKIRQIVNHLFTLPLVEENQIKNGGIRNA